MLGFLLTLFLSTVQLCCSFSSLSQVEQILLNKRLGDIQLKTREKFGLSLNGREKKSDLVLIFPGAGGPDQFTDELETTLTNYLNKKTSDSAPLMNLFSRPSKGTVVKTLDWQEFRGSLLTAAYDGEAFGEEVGEIIWNDSMECKSIHCIGISVGAFAANACMSTLNKKRTENESTSQNTYLRLTLLDPFTSRGVGGSSYGDKHFGLEADYAEQYLNTDDPVPSTNEALSLCTTYDVTGAQERNDFKLPENESMHCWPLVYFARYGYKDSAGKILVHEEDGMPSRESVLMK